MDKSVKAKFDTYPKAAKQTLLAVRCLIFDIAEQDQLGSLEECLKWGEPSYLAKKGSTIRMDWKEKSPEYCGLYFTCNSSLVETFQQLYPDDFIYQGHRAILLPLNTELNIIPLKDCLAKALKYHTIKHLPLLGG
ncbi:DUF1801 domain-containing protein [Pseudomonas sp. HK3]